MRAALGFLTLLRVGEATSPPGPGALAVFPLIGGLLGVAWVATATAGAAIGGELVAAGLVLVVDLLVTGGMHLDALADMADGVASRLPPLEAQTVMREPQIGAVGAATLCTALILRFALISAALATPAALIAAPAGGRAAMVWALGRLPKTPGAAGGSGRAGQLPGSLGTALAPAAGPAIRAGAVTLSAVVAAGAFALGGHPQGAVVISVVVVASTSVGVSEAAARWWARHFGFLSGDVVGAVGVVVELVVLAGLLLLTE